MGLPREIILIDCGIALKEVPLTPGGSNAITVHPITAGSAKLRDWLIMEAEETLENNIKGPQERH